MMLFMFGIYVIAVLYLIYRLSIRADEFFMKKYHDNIYACFSSRVMIIGVSLFLLGTALDLFMKIIS